MEASIAQTKIKWREPSNPTKFELRYPPPQPIHTLPDGQKLEAWDNWVSVMMDLRLEDSERAILTRVALHYNLETGECFPSAERVAIEVGFGKTIETGKRAVFRAIKKCIALGWIAKTYRFDRHHKQQTNAYGLTLPKSIQDILARRLPPLKVIGRPGEWYVVQVADGMAICGPFRGETDANAKWWIDRH